MPRLLLPAIALLAAPASAAPAVPPPVPPMVGQVPVALLVDLSAGQTLYAHNAEQRFLPASMTKAMSALVAFDLIAAGKLDENRVVSVRPDTAARWAGKGTTLALRPGERVRIGDLVMGLTTVSANDAAVALAEAALGSDTAWLAAMNARARSLGMNGSQFASANGFPDRRQTYVTARDLVRLAQALIVDHPVLYRRYFGHRAMAWRGQSLSSHDPFAAVALPGADGIKTGHTFEAGFNFLGAVERNGRRLIVVIGGARSEDLRARSAIGLAEWGYAAWDTRPLLAAGTVVGQVGIADGAQRRLALAVPRAFVLAVPRVSNPAVETRIVLDRPLRAPVRRGQVVAGLEVAVSGQPAHYLPLVAAQDVAPAGPFDRIANALLGLWR